MRDPEKLAKVADFVAAHPTLIGLLFTACAAFTAWNCYSAGMAVANIRGLTARAASEALGG
jgi:hypothetical protein